MKLHEIVIRHIDGYGWLPIVREYGLTSGRPGPDLYRGDFYKTPGEAFEAGQLRLAEVSQ